MLPQARMRAARGRSRPRSQLRESSTARAKQAPRGRPAPHAPRAARLHAFASRIAPLGAVLCRAVLQHVISRLPFPSCPPQFWELVILVIGIAESVRISAGWNSLSAPATQQIKESYSPGQLGFDPLGLFPTDAAAQFEIQTKEINNGARLLRGCA